MPRASMAPVTAPQVSPMRPMPPPNGPARVRHICSLMASQGAQAANTDWAQLKVLNRVTALSTLDMVGPRFQTVSPGGGARKEGWTLVCRGGAETRRKTRRTTEEEVEHGGSGGEWPSVRCDGFPKRSS